MKYHFRCTSEQLLIITLYTVKFFFSISVDSRLIATKWNDHFTKLYLISAQKSNSNYNRVSLWKWSKPLVTSFQVTYVICPVLSPAHSRTAYQTRCEIFMSHLQLLCKHHALYNTYTIYNSYSKCHTFRWKLPDVPIPNTTRVYNHMKRFQATNWNESFRCAHSKHNSSQLHEKGFRKPVPA